MFFLEFYVFPWVDASNAFNSMNRVKALQTVKSLCPPFYQYLSNTYQTPSHQYISGSKEGHFIWSQEGATQGDNCAMAYYALGTRPIIEKLNNEVSEAIQVFYADDNSACGTLDALLKYWKELAKVGPEYGYYPNAEKTILIVKHQEDLQRAKDLFEPLKVKINYMRGGKTSRGCGWVRRIQGQICTVKKLSVGLRMWKTLQILPKMSHSLHMHATPRGCLIDGPM